MTLGLSVSLIVTFYLLPSLIMVFSNDDDIELQETSDVDAKVIQHIQNIKI